MAGSRKVYAPEFKLQAVAMITAQKLSVAEVARLLSSRRIGGVKRPAARLSQISASGRRSRRVRAAGHPSIGAQDCRQEVGEALVDFNTARVIAHFRAVALAADQAGLAEHLDVRRQR